MSESAFRKSVRQAVRGLWSGAISRAQFKSAMASALRRNLSVAWVEGARECGIEVTELTDEELKARDAFIKEQEDFVSGLADGVREGDRASGGKIADLLGRAELWVNRYNDARNRGKQLACADKKLKWQIGPTEQHCRDCSKYNGRVHRGSVWGEIRPQSASLACHGFRCKCQLVPTTERATGGKPPRMTG